MKRAYRCSLWIAMLSVLYPLSTMSATTCKLCGTNTLSLGDFKEEVINKEPQICLNCHPERAHKPEHVINVKVKEPISAPLPLLNGMVTCVTCHDPFGTSKHLLRYDKKTLCAVCHHAG